MKKNKLLYTGSEWAFEDIEKVWQAIEKIAKEDFGLDYYPPQFEVITAEQMLDNYSSNGLPSNYSHWSFGKSFIQNQKEYQQGKMGLAYEIVINSNPCIAYLMEENTITMQTLVMAHAACGHGHVFKNNYLFKEWSDADFILDYMKYSKKYISECESKYGSRAVEELIDACHSLQYHGIDKYRKPKLNKEILRNKKLARQEAEEQNFNDIWRTLPEKMFPTFNIMDTDLITEEEKDIYYAPMRDKLPEENILYFIEKHGPKLQSWEREVIRIVRTISQYFYPQMQTKLLHEGFASFTHYHIMNKLFDDGLIDEGSYLEFIRSHTSVVMQPDFDHDWYSGINVYALGFAMFQDIKRMCEKPDEEDLKYFPDICNTDWRTTTQDIVANYRDESFISQFLSLKVIKQFKIFSLEFDGDKNFYEVEATQEEQFLKDIRLALSQHYDLSHKLPQIEITEVDWYETRKMGITFYSKNNELLDRDSALRSLNYMEYLWGFEVYADFEEVNKDE